MRLAKLIEEFVAEQDWGNDEVERDEEAGTSRLRTNLAISNQSFRLFIESDEAREMLFLYLYPPFSVIEGKSVDACLLFNYLNDQFNYRGRLIVSDTGTICYKDIIDVEKIEPNTAMIDNMLCSGQNLFVYHIEAIAAIALTKKTYEAIRAEYDKEDATKEAMKRRKETEGSDD